MRQPIKPFPRLASWIATVLLRWTLGLGILGVGPRSGARDFLVHNWDSDEGLPCNWINTVVRTDDGYVWLGTQEGLIRFDGNRFHLFSTENTPALKDNRITALLTDRQRTLWAGTINGTLTRYDQGAFQAVDLGGTPGGRKIRSLVADVGGNLWLATDGAGLIRLRNGQAIALTTANGLPSADIWQLLEDQRGRIWYVAAPGELGWVEGLQCRNLKGSVALPNSIVAMALARDGGLWLATLHGNDAGTRIFKFKEGSVTEETTAYPWVQSSERARAGALFEDAAGNLWCGMLGDGVFVRAVDGSWRKLAPETPAARAETLSLTGDEGESILIGSRTSGFYQAVPRPLTTYELPGAHNQHLLLTVCVRRDGSIWGGTDQAGLFRWEHPRVNDVGREQGFSGQRINGLLEDTRSNLWIGTSTGLFLFADSQSQLKLPPVLTEKITALHEDRRGNLWAGTAHGLIGFGGNSDSFTASNGLPAGQIMAVTESEDGKLWVALEGQGVFYQQGSLFLPWRPASGAGDAYERWKQSAQARIHALLADRDGSIWAATHGDGLFRLAGDSIRMWGWEHDGLPSNHFFAMLDDDEGNLWFSSENGLFGYSKSELLNYRDATSRPVPLRLTRREGLPSKVASGFSQPTATRSVDGRLWFPDGSALVAFQPAAIPRHTKTWPPVIEEVRRDGVALPIPRAGPLCIRSGQRSVEIDFTSPDILSPARLLFRYRLDGLDKEWSAEGPRRSAQYSQLPPGNYTFRVMTRKNDRAWSESTAALRLTIVPRYWETRWFQVVAGLAFISVIVLAVRQRERARSRRKLAGLERERALALERARIARDIHDDLGASLTQVALLGNLAGHAAGNPAELREQTRQIAALARDMSQALETIVWAVRAENDSLRSLVDYMSRRTDELFQTSPRQYHFILPDTLPDCTVHAEVRHNVVLAYKEALTNVFKHAAGATVRIEVTCVPEHCRITIADDGAGFDTTRPRPGGSGLRNMRHRLEEIGGHFHLQSQPGQGTTVHLDFPLPRNGPTP